MKRVTIALLALILLGVPQTEANCLNYSITVEIKPSVDKKVDELTPWLQKLAGRIGTAVRSKVHDTDKTKTNLKRIGRFLTFREPPITKPAKCLIRLKHNGKPNISIKTQKGNTNQNQKNIIEKLVSNAFPVPSPPNELPYKRSILLEFQPEGARLVIVASIIDSAACTTDELEQLLKVEPSDNAISLEELLDGPPGTYYGGYDARPPRSLNSIIIRDGR